MNKQPKKVFLSFADSRMVSAAARLTAQAQAMQFFDEIHILNEHNLDADFYAHHRHLMTPTVRGFGYWLWKPHIIRTQLEKLQENDILIYCDAGCHLNPKGMAKLEEYISKLQADALGVKAFPVCASWIDVYEKRWTKGDIFSYFDCRDNREITESAQIAATQIYIRKCQASMDFVTEWESICCSNIALIDDSRSKTPNSVFFLDNRHDQSLFSVLFKLRGGVAFPAGETDLPKTAALDKFPIWNSRDKGVKDKRLHARLQRYLKAKLIKLRLKWQPIKCRIITALSRGVKPF